ncbi:NAD(P)/FAD-dependent oxidoreductase [Cephaloticoccus primus]|uniref:NAD(P)/FAD-dependent oxidoreductase n=1 Tax=Cephaloticoccus primus TaxID=1548207 RepID=UPI001E3DF431|nr:NAD(P)/FAD-dependent oxidoreductase [Cephaloticoccus primus]
MLIVGGGAAGFFAAITCAQANPTAQVTICEATAHPLAKVRISGGGRCNVTHACYEPRELVQHYPRGGRELRGAFHQWQPRDMVAWLEARGVPLKTEADGRVFPVADDSAVIVDCLQRAARDAGVAVKLRLGVRAVERCESAEPEANAGTTGAAAEAQGEGGPDAARADAAESHPATCAGGPRFRVTLTDGSTTECERVLIATGGNRASVGTTIAQNLGHTIEPPVPSLFTFHVDDPRIDGLSGISVGQVSLSVPTCKGLTSEGPLLITHWGLSGPAVLKLSAWGARAFAACDYEFPLKVNFAPPHTRESAQHALAALRTEQPRRQIARGNPFGLPARLWERLVQVGGVSEGQAWAGLSNARLGALAEALCAARFAVRGKSTNKDEFVTCGGVRLREVDFKTMESRLCPGLHFAGEVLDIDGVTGGFNFQAAWTTGRLAGLAMSGRA